MKKYLDLEKALLEKERIEQTSVDVDWDFLEEYIMTEADSKKLDCWFVDIRELTRFKEQYEAIHKFVVEFPNNTDLSHDEIRVLLLCGYSYKKSPFECSVDMNAEERGRWQLAGIDWDMIYLCKILHDTVNVINTVNIKEQNLFKFKKVLPLKTKMFSCINGELTSLIGIPIVSDLLDVRDNKINSLIGLNGQPKNIIIRNNPISTFLGDIIDFDKINEIVLQLKALEISLDSIQVNKQIETVYVLELSVGNFNTQKRWIQGTYSSEKKAQEIAHQIQEMLLSKDSLSTENTENTEAKNQFHLVVNELRGLSLSSINPSVVNFNFNIIPTILDSKGELNIKTLKTNLYQG